MEREYRNSVKGRLTKYLVLIVMSSVFMIYAVIMTFSVKDATERQDLTTAELNKLEVQNFRSELNSRSG